MIKKFMLIFFVLFVTINHSHISVYAQEEKMPSVDATGAILMDFETGRVLWAKNANKPLAMASTTKIMTAILTLENGNLEDTVIVSRKASLAPKVNMSLKQGEKIKLKYLLYALMLQSSNDAAVAIAEHIGGSVENFCKMMTEKAAEIGAQDTLFETPNGLDAGNHHSTAYDLAVITRYALKNQKFVEIINTQTITAPSNLQTRTIYNKNRLLNEFTGANGVKTGFTGKAGHCFVGSAKRNGMQLISVVLASGWGDKGKEQKWTDTKTILNYGFVHYKYENVVKKDDAAGIVNIERSKTTEIPTYFEEGFCIPLTTNEKDLVRVELEYPSVKRAPVSINECLGIAKIYLGDVLYKEVRLLAKEEATRHDLKTSLEKIITNWLEMGSNSEKKIVLPEF